jgi:hypothetical protein
VFRLSTRYCAGSACDTTQWLSASSALCKTITAGFDTAAPEYRGQVVLTMQTNVQYTLLQGFSFDLPVLSSVLRGNAPVDGAGAVITVTGTNFGGYSFSEAQSVRVGLSSCASTIWTSDSTLACGLAQGVSAFLPLQVTAGVDFNSTVFLRPRRGSLGSCFSYDVGKVSLMAAYNGPPAAQPLMISAYGRNFGCSDYSLLTRLGQTATESTLWASDSALVLKGAAGSQNGLALFATIGGLNLTLGAQGLVGTSDLIFSYDAPAATAASRGNLPPNSRQDVAAPSAFNLTGSNFGAWDLTATGRLGGSTCLTTSWNRDDSMLCMAAAGIARTLAAQITLQVNVGSGPPGIVSFDSPALGNTSSGNYAPAASVGIMWNASNLAPVASSMRARVGASACPSTIWTSDSALAVRLAPGVQGSLSVVATVGVAVGSAQGTASYDRLLIQWAMQAGQSNGSATGAPPGGGSNAPTAPPSPTSVPLSGSGFGSAAYSASSRLAGSSASSTAWQSDSCVLCSAAAGGTPRPAPPLLLHSLACALCVCHEISCQGPTSRLPSPFPSAPQFPFRLKNCHQALPVAA